jgi:hypothetical protein
MKLELTGEDVTLLLKGMDTIIQMAQRSRWPLARVQPFIDLMHKIDRQTLEDRFGVREGP